MPRIHIALLRRGHLPAKCWSSVAPNVMSSNMLFPQHWSMLSQHSLQVDPLRAADLITAAGQQAAPSSTPVIETTDLLIHLYPSEVI